MESNSQDLTRQRFATFAQTVVERAGQANLLIQAGNHKRAQQITGLLVEEACLHLRRLNGVPDNYDDSEDGAENDYSLTNLNTEFGNDSGKG